MDENLVGYLLKALNADEQRNVEDYLRQHPEAQKRLELLRRQLDQLAGDAGDAEPAAGLWLRTLAKVAEHKCRTLPSAPPTARPAPAVRVSWWRRADVLVAAALLVLVGGLGLVWLGLTADRRHVVECANNLRLFHQALVAYADTNDDGKFPWVQSQPPRNFAGSFVPELNEKQVVPAGLSVGCPGSPPRPPSSLTFAELEKMPPEERREATRSLGGCYAYSLGYEEDGRYLGLTRNMDGRLPIMADAPPCRTWKDVGDGNSPNHAGKGQNVLFIDGHVEFRTTRGLGADDNDIFLNAEGRVAPGRGPRDAVLGRSDAVSYSTMLDE